MGVNRGISDFIFVGLRFVAFIEMKFGKGSQFKEQVEFENMVFNSGHLYFIVKDVQEWKQLILELVAGC